MEFKEIKELIDAVNSSDISFFELTINDAHIKMDKSLNRSIVSENNEIPVKEVSLDTEEKVACTTASPKERVESIEESKTHEEEYDKDFTVIKSPMVGTFYAAPSADAPAFVKAGGKVNKGDGLCIIEAMKLMNEIESDYSGTIKEVLVKNGEMVEYGQPMFKIKED